MTGEAFGACSLGTTRRTRRLGRGRRSEPRVASRGRAAPALMKMAGEAKDPQVREAAREVLRKALSPPAYPRAVVDEIRRMCECRPTGKTLRTREADGRLRLTTKMAGNGCTFLIVEPR